MASRRDSSNQHQSYLKELGYEGDSVFSIVGSFFSIPSLFLILFKITILWMSYTLITNHLTYLDYELRTEQQQSR